jgi:hypothetical protein
MSGRPLGAREKEGRWPSVTIVALDDRRAGPVDATVRTGGPA